LTHYDANTGPLTLRAQLLPGRWGHLPGLPSLARRDRRLGKRLRGGAARDPGTSAGTGTTAVHRAPVEVN